ncbi:polysaccharide biosynthesis protein GtrA [Rhodococcus oxybenzonivorans]|uniref:Polysaccharide biosynthesis protein GtrA n=1 Tax=Rhodococcus oxybenzonivorans TaxID=1990687 RepID=A0A2S2BPM8_9NOCA|nr:GtrA family protein [Rhodococcus oxybenzonivorans]AWK70571.1 polysaccharide biosynthesis protein GtrA [Rhodococcus oxybenzonivorans]
MSETKRSHEHEHHVPLPVEIPVTENIADDSLDLKTQIVRFVLTGGLSAIVDFGLYWLLLELVGLPINVAKSISFIAGTTTAYLINRRWTFKAEPSRARFVAVVILYAVTFAVQVGLNWVMYQAFPDEWWRLPLAFVIAQGTATVINFVVQRAVIFKIR